MMYKIFLHPPLIEKLAAFSESDLIDAAALLLGLSVSGAFPDFVNTEDDNGYELEDTLDESLSDYLGRVKDYGDEWLILLSSSPARHIVTVKALARTDAMPLKTFAEADQEGNQPPIPLSEFLAILSPALNEKITTLHQSLTAPAIARQRLMSARHAALSEAKSLFNLSQPALTSFEKRCDHLLDLLRRELGDDVTLTLHAHFADGTRLNATSLSTLGKSS